METKPETSTPAINPPTDTGAALTSVVTKRDLTVNGVRAPFLESGDTASTSAVVFLHGNPGSSGDFRRLVEQIGTFSRVLAIDMPGFGQADKPADFAYDVPGYVAFLDNALQQLGVHRTQLVMHDFGGGWGLGWAAQHPQQVSSLTLINTGVTLGYRWHRAARLWQTPIVGEIVMASTNRGNFTAGLNAGQKNNLPPEFIDEMYNNFDKETRRAVLKLYRAHKQPATMSSALIGALKQFSAPVLVVWGKYDPYLPIEMAERQAEVFADIRYAWFENAAHWPFIDDPDGVAGVLLPFLRQHA